MIRQQVSGRKFRPTPSDDGQIHIIPPKVLSMILKPRFLLPALTTLGLIRNIHFVFRRSSEAELNFPPKKCVVKSYSYVHSSRQKSASKARRTDATSDAIAR